MRAGKARHLAAALAKHWMIMSTANENGGEWDASVLEAVTGSATMNCDFEGSGRVNCGSVALYGGGLPCLRNADRAIMQHMIIAPVSGAIGGTLTLIKMLASRMFEIEGPAILGKLLQARARYMREGLIIPASWRKATNDHLRNMDVDGQWLEERVTFDPNMGRKDKIRLKDFYEDRVRWADDTGHRATLPAINNWSDRLKGHPLVQKHGVQFSRDRTGEGQNKAIFALGMRLSSNVGSQAGHSFGLDIPDDVQ